ncbi:CinA family protein [Porphyromonas sp.]|uniref:CinA family protein n=1 Tax=Porphyromonas sp. TaxID=1924944 RepID=UPI0026DA9046|nr:CinA family protein [Porphyromonas sp.]MDO4695181.1 CinA family protein [Porphyromonas sp.]MDO4770927.1 CinA family protein [Porphyromonas sp.]
MSDLRRNIYEIANAIAERLSSTASTISVAESCTGGAIASSLCAISGASGWFDTGIVAYTYESKKNQLNIPQSILDKGLVTRETAEAMAINVRSLSSTVFSIATTGVCGPTENEGHAPCYVWIAVASADGVYSYLYQSTDAGREQNILSTTEASLTLLLSIINKQ